MRPVRRYYFEFQHEQYGDKVKLYALGTTPCNAKNAAFLMLDQYLKLTPGAPVNGWRVAVQRDEGLA